MTKLIPFLKNPRIATVNKWVYEERRGGNRTGRLFQKLLIKLVQNLTRYFSYIGRDPVLTKVLCSYHRNGLTIYFIYLKIGIYSMLSFFFMVCSFFYYRRRYERGAF